MTDTSPERVEAEAHAIEGYLPNIAATLRALSERVQVLEGVERAAREYMREMDAGVKDLGLCVVRRDQLRSALSAYDAKVKDTTHD